MGSLNINWRNLVEEFSKLASDTTLSTSDLAKLAKASGNFSKEEVSVFSQKIENENFARGYNMGGNEITDDDIDRLAKSNKLSAKEVAFVKEMRHKLNDFNKKGEIKLDLGDNVEFSMKNEGQRTLADGTLQQGFEANAVQRITVEGSKTGNYGELVNDFARGTQGVRFFDKNGNRMEREDFYTAEKINDDYRIDDKGNIYKPTLWGALKAFVQGVGEGAVAEAKFAATVAALPLAALSSCSPDEPNVTNIHSGDVNVEVNSNQVITMPMSLNLDTSGLKAYLEQVLNQMINENRTYNQAILDALQTIIANQIKQGATLEAILSAIGNNDKILEMILKALMQGNQLLQDVRGLMETNNKQNDEILKVTLQILEKLNGIEKAIAELTAKFPGLTAQLNAILNAIKNNQGGTSDPTAILAMLEEVIRLLKSIEKSTAATEETTRKILAAIQKLGTDQAANFALLIDAINNNSGGHGPDYTNLLNLILAKLDKIDQTNQNGYEALLNKMDKILQAIKDHNITIDITGTVTCNCNCGHGGDDNGGHEGIINDITGLITS